MANKKQQYIPLVIALVIIVGGIIYFKNKKSENPTSTQTPSSQNQQPGSQSSPNSNSQTNTENAGLTGTLKISNDLKRGNLMLELPDHTIYLFTSRDYSSLLDKEVVVNIEGTVDNFKLIDIKAK